LIQVSSLPPFYLPQAALFVYRVLEFAMDKKISILTPKEFLEIVE